MGTLGQHQEQEDSKDQLGVECKRTEVEACDRGGAS